MGKIFQFPGKKSNLKKGKVVSRKGGTPSSGTPTLTRFTWVGFPRPPALNAEFNMFQPPINDINR